MLRLVLWRVICSARGTWAGWGRGRVPRLLRTLRVLLLMLFLRTSPGCPPCSSPWPGAWLRLRLGGRMGGSPRLTLFLMLRRVSSWRGSCRWPGATESGGWSAFFPPEAALFFLMVSSSDW